MFKCPFCQSTDCEELLKHPYPITPQYNQPFTGYPYPENDNCIEVLCRGCGIITKIDPYFYKGQDDENDK